MNLFPARDITLVASFTFNLIKERTVDDGVLQPGNIYRVSTGSDALQAVQPTLPWFYKGISVKRLGMHAGEFVVYVSVEGRDSVRIPNGATLFESLHSAETPEAVVAPLKKVTVAAKKAEPPPDREWSDEEKQRRFMESDDEQLPAGKAKVVVRPINSIPPMPANLSAPTLSGKPANRVGDLKADGAVEGGTSAKEV
jgi:hypothetical protein